MFKEGDTVFGTYYQIMPTIFKFKVTSPPVTMQGTTYYKCVWGDETYSISDDRVFKTEKQATESLHTDSYRLIDTTWCD